MSQQITEEALQEIRDSIQAFNKALQTSYILAMKWAKKAYDTLYGVYAEQGFPFGEGHEGFIKWIESLQQEEKTP